MVDVSGDDAVDTPVLRLARDSLLEALYVAHRAPNPSDRVAHRSSQK
ncbi:MAG TPA: hypothetical protein VKA32_05440 [Gammaproteobacteria bacterium]|nr:hypothetical protein [Gammaproteobacteria bacterium]